MSKAPKQTAPATQIDFFADLYEDTNTSKSLTDMTIEELREAAIAAITCTTKGVKTLEKNKMKSNGYTSISCKLANRSVFPINPATGKKRQPVKVNNPADEASPEVVTMLAAQKEKAINAITQAIKAGQCDSEMLAIQVKIAAERKQTAERQKKKRADNAAKKAAEETTTEA